MRLKGLAAPALCLELRGRCRATRTEPVDLRKFWTAFLSLFLCFLPGDLSAQVIRGRVLEVTTDAAIAGAKVELVDRAGRVQLSAMADSAGGFFLAGPPGRYTLRVETLGYAGYTTAPLDMNAGEELTIEVRMAPSAIPLEPLRVLGRQTVAADIAEFYARSNAGFGHFITRADLERMRATSLLPAVSTVPRTRMFQPRIGPPILIMSGSGARECTPAVYLNNMPIDPAELTSILPEMIEGIEIYTSAAQMPSSVPRRPAAAAATLESIGAPPTSMECGVVMLWLRRDARGSAFTWKRLGVGLGIFVVLALLSR